MNKKGFAVSVILYSVVFLIVTTLFMLLGIMRTRFNVNNQLRKNIISEINGEIDLGAIISSRKECSITGNTTDYTDNLILTINVNNGSAYSWDNETYSDNNTIKVNRAGEYIGYFKDADGGSGSCSVNIESKNQQDNESWLYKIK